MFVRHQAFRESGRWSRWARPAVTIEIYSKRSPTCSRRLSGAIPCGSKSNARMAGRDRSAGRCAQSVHPDFRLRSQLCESSSLRQHNMPLAAGSDVVNPQDASAQSATVTSCGYSMHGQVLAGAVVSIAMRRALARIHEGARYDLIKAAISTRYVSTAANVVTLDIGTSQLAQAIAHIRRWWK